MSFAIETDNENNKAGKPGIAKLRMVDKVITKLKSHSFASVFLDHSGLEIINKFINKLPDGSWPLSTVRGKLLSSIYGLPIHMEHIKKTELGKTLSALLNSNKELPENKKMIQHIKDKWYRIICEVSAEYTKLESYERELAMPTLRLPTIEDDAGLGKRGQLTEEDLSVNVGYHLAKARNMGYNFSVRPSSAYNPHGRKTLENQVEMDKYLMRMKRNSKKD